jgi:hypothetical protein
MRIVKHSFHTGHQSRVDHIDYFKHSLPKDYTPLSALSKDVVPSRKGATFMKCPAITDFFKNTWVFKSPIDLNIDVEVNDDYSKVYCDNVDQEFFDLMIDIRFLQNHEKGASPYPLIGIDFLNTFTSAESLTIQTLPAFLHYSEFINKATIIPGEYDISKWTRPVEVVFEVKNKKERIEIKKGDALCYFKFLTSDSIKLTQDTTPWDEITVCNDIRNANVFRPLKERYDSFEKWREDNKKD